MRTIAIILGDNDFGNTFLNLLETIKRVIAFRSANLESPYLTESMEQPQTEVITPENVELMIRALAMSHYIAFQYSFRLGDYKAPEHLSHTAEYLNKLRVLFDEEAEKDISEGWRNGEAWYLELQSGIIKSY